jgi:hypothetical protein
MASHPGELETFTPANPTAGYRRATTIVILRTGAHNRAASVRQTMRPQQRVQTCLARVRCCVRYDLTIPRTPTSHSHLLPSPTEATNLLGGGNPSMPLLRGALPLAATSAGQWTTLGSQSGTALVAPRALCGQCPVGGKSTASGRRFSAPFATWSRRLCPSRLSHTTRYIDPFPSLRKMFCARRLPH